MVAIARLKRFLLSGTASETLPYRVRGTERSVSLNRDCGNFGSPGSVGFERLFLNLVNPKRGSRED